MSSLGNRSKKATYRCDHEIAYELYRAVRWKFLNPKFKSSAEDDDPSSEKYLTLPRRQALQEEIEKQQKAPFESAPTARELTRIVGVNHTRCKPVLEYLVKAGVLQRKKKNGRGYFHYFTGPQEKVKKWLGAYSLISIDFG